MGRAVIIVLALLAVFFLIVMYVDNHRFVVRRYSFRSNRIKKGLKAVFVADLHEKDYGDHNRSLIGTIRGEEPDVILVGGDLLVSALFTNRIRRDLGIRHMEEGGQMTPPVPTDESWMQNSIQFMRDLTEIAPVYFVYGNHEERLCYEICGEYKKAFDEAIRGLGAHMLRNERVPLIKRGEDTGIDLQGLELPIDYYVKFHKNELTDAEMERMAGRPDPSRYTVLLTHSPVYGDRYMDWGADLSLCGHVHGGLMRLPVVGGVMGTGPNLFPKYSGGLYTDKDGGRNLIVTCGLGAHTLAIRIFDPGEVTVIELEPEEGDKNGTGKENGRN